MKYINMKSLVVMCTFFALTSCSSKTAVAQNNERPSADQQERHRREPPQFSDLLEKMDENEDGLLSLKEVEGPLKDDFEKIDKNNDGFITSEEFKNAPKPKGKGRHPKHP